MQIVERWILAKLRHHKFFSLGQLNEAIKALLAELNGRRFSKLPGTRKSLFIELDKPALKPLPGIRYQYKEIRVARVAFDYHIEVEGCFYSVPYELVTRQVEVHITDSTVCIYYQGNQMAIHGRLQKPGRYTTKIDHMPHEHKFYRQWSPEKFIQWAEKIGSHTTTVIQGLLSKRQHPEQGFRACLGILNFAKQYSVSRLEAACQRAMQIGSPCYKSIGSILKQGLDHLTIDGQKNVSHHSIIQHENVRGPEYYH